MKSNCFKFSTANFAWLQHNVQCRSFSSWAFWWALIVASLWQQNRKKYQSIHIYAKLLSKISFHALYISFHWVEQNRRGSCLLSPNKSEHFLQSKIALILVQCKWLINNELYKAFYVVQALCSVGVHYNLCAIGMIIYNIIYVCITHAIIRLMKPASSQIVIDISKHEFMSSIKKIRIQEKVTFIDDCLWNY